MALKTQKALEIKVNETLYTNIYFLTQTYPPHKDFWDVFKKDMFIKNNKAAFQHVIYYLLCTLNPKVIKEKIPSWPILDSQYERQFRNEVTKYLNELNNLYEHANMPTIMASHFVSPGGFKFAKYMLKFTIIVRYQCVMENLENTNLILYKKCENDTEKNVKRLNILTSHIQKESEKTKLDFLNYEMSKSKVEASAIVKKLDDLQKCFPELQEKLRILESKNDDSSQDLDEIFNIKIKSLEDGVLKIKNICNKLTKIRSSLTYLTREDLTLEYKLKNTNDAKLDLISFFKRLNLEMEKYCLQMKVLSDQGLEHYIEKFSKSNSEMLKLESELENLKEAWLKTSNNIKKVEKQKKHCRKALKLSPLKSVPNSGNSTALAVPLDDS